MVRRSFWVGFGSSRSALPWRSVSGLALSAGCCGWSLRGSFRSASGSVLWASFSGVGSARAFAGSVSRSLGRSVVVRPGVCSSAGLVWVVSVPVLR